MLDLYAIRFIKGTKVSHDYEGKDVNMFSYRDLIGRGIDAIGIPCKQNRLIVIDVDVVSTQHKHDGREWWTNFVNEAGIPPTYTVRSASGGFHFYYRLPEHMDENQFAPPARLAPGVDVKYNGWVGAPPTEGYTVFNGNITTIQIAPPALIAELLAKKSTGATREFQFDPTTALTLHQPYTADQIHDLRGKLKVVQQATLSRDEWRDGLFALKAGLDDPAILEEFIDLWTHNRSYAPGDEIAAREMVERADKHGRVGPGTIYGIIKNVLVREGAPLNDSPFTRQEIFDKAKVPLKFNKDNTLTVPATESNAAALIGAMFPPDVLYHDIRSDHYFFRGSIASDVDIVNTVIPMIQSTTYGLGLEKMSGGCIAKGLEVLLHTRKIDPHAEWLKSLRWDGRPRIDRFFIDYVGCVESKYTLAVSKNFWITLASRGLCPGEQVDFMIVLEGNEGIRKSSIFKAIGGQYTSDPINPSLMTDLDELRKMHQSSIVELPELIGLMGKDPETVKGFITKRFDDIRGLFAKKAVRKHRGFVLVGTTNSKRYLDLDMGDRRFLPLIIPDTVKSINFSSIVADRDQLYAEAVHRYKQGEPWHIIPVEEHAKIIKMKRNTEPMLRPIKEMMDTLPEHFTLLDVYNRLEIKGFVNKGLNTTLFKRIENSLRTLGAVESYDDVGESVWTFGKKAEINMFI